jgi:PmbA protein
MKRKERGFDLDSGEIQGLADLTMKSLKGAGFTDVIVYIIHSRVELTRFDERGVSLSGTNDGTLICLNLGNGKSKFCAYLDVSSESEIKKKIPRLKELSRACQKTDVYAGLPEPVDYKECAGMWDPRVNELDHSEILEEMGNKISESPHLDTAGIIRNRSEKLAILTSEGEEGFFKRSLAEFNCRVIGKEKGSGQGIAVSTSLQKFKWNKEFEMACTLAERAENPRKIEPGRYRVILGPAVVANLIGEIGNAASAYMVDAGMSFFVDADGKQVSSKKFSLWDWGSVPEGPASSPFDMEGVPAQKTPVIKNGRALSLLHNLTTAKKFGKTTTGNAGWISPAPTNLIVESGNIPEEKIVEESENAIWINGNWYTRFQDYREATFSTVTRDALFRIENGEVKYPIKGLRISDSMLNLLRNIGGGSKERKWIKWWDAETPVLSPSLIIDGLNLTTPS